jgi:alpha-galactosidase
VLVDIARDMEQVAKPGAIMLQYANPMAANCLALGRVSNVPFVGLCHGVQTTLDLIAGYCEVDKNDIAFHLRGHQPHGLVFDPDAQADGPRSVPILRESSSSPNTTKTKRCAARCSGTSATS